MPTANLADAPARKQDSASKNTSRSATVCFHCGTECIGKPISYDTKAFCCDGCKLVYEIINNNGLCNYYELQQHPGLRQIKALKSHKFAFLDNEEIAARLYSFTDGNHTTVKLYLPGVHCSSCLWLLEHLYRVHPGVTSSRLSFATKEATISFKREEISLREIADLLTTIGYEPYISLEDESLKKTSKPDRSRIYKLGVAGFCFGNIMMMSFPEYFGGEGIESQYALLFRVLNLVLALPVFFFSASEFFVNAWAGFRTRMLNIDAPIALAILITFSRSLYEIFSGTGSGYLDSMSGIVFFMLVGRVVQERTYRSVSFHRDYKSYFPIAVSVVTKEGVQSKSLHELRQGDVVELHHDEIIPADGVLTAGKAHIDYSFVTGESKPVTLTEGAVVYAGGKQTGDVIQVQLTQPVAGSYLTSLWNHNAFRKDKVVTGDRESSIHVLSRYFTMVLFTLAGITAVYWSLTDPSKVLPSVTAMLIVACPCALLLSATFTNASVLRLLSSNGLFVRDAAVIETLGKADFIAFDKTGTLTENKLNVFADRELNLEEAAMIAAVARPSRHPFSIALFEQYRQAALPEITAWQEHYGQGVEAIVCGESLLIGNASFTGADVSVPANVFARIGDTIIAFTLKPEFRNGTSEMIQKLTGRFGLSLLSGDNNAQEPQLRSLFGDKTHLLFGQKPLDKLQYVQRAQSAGHTVVMIGDGLNDAGALQQSNVGITLAADVNNFTPACDAILDAAFFPKLPVLLQLARLNGQIIRISFAFSILYNLVGLFFSVRGLLSPVIAAILMPASTLTIVLISTGISMAAARMLGLNGQPAKS